MSITTKVDAMVSSLGDLTPEQHVHAELARTLAATIDSEPQAYTMPNLARELRAAVAALAGETVVGRGITDADIAALLEGL